MESLVKEGALGAILHRSGIIGEEDIRRALDEQHASGCRFGEALVKLGIVMQEDIEWALSNQLDIPFVRLSEKIIDRNAVELVPGNLARKYNLIPIIQTGNELHIALADPLNKTAVSMIEEVSGCKVTISVPIIRELREMLDIYYGPPENDATFGFSSSSFSEPVLEKINADRSGAQFLENLLRFFLRNEITSIALQPGGGEVHVSGRREGIFREIGCLPLASYPEVVSRIRKISGINGSRELLSRGEFVFHYHEDDIILQVAMVRALEGECISIMMRPNISFPAGIGEMDISPDTEREFRSLGSPGAGLVLFASRNRPERGRFLDLFLREMDTTERNIFLLGEGIGKGKAPYPRIPLASGASADRENVFAALLDHTPDVIVVDDVSDSRSFLNAWKTAMRGCLVVAGLSRAGLGGAVDHLLRECRENRSLPLGLRGIVAFAGINILCPSCRENNGAHVHAPGCPDCRYSGHGGKKYLVDVLPFDPESREILASARESDEFFSRLKGRHYRGIAGKLSEMLRDGELCPEEYRAALAQYSDEM